MKEAKKVNTVAIRMTATQQPSRHLYDLVIRAKDGDTVAFEELYRENLGRVYALCLRMTRNKSQAEDLTQEAFIRAWQKLGSFRGDSAFSTWMHRLTANLVLMALKSQKRRSEKVFSTDDLTPFERPDTATTATSGLGMDIEKAIASLPNQARKIFVFYQIEGYKHDEIAYMLGLATGTTKAQLHRARKMLREVLA